MQKYVVYIDQVLTSNLVMDYAVLWLTAKFTRIQTSTRRLLAGSAIGAVYALAVYVPGWDLTLSLAVKAVVSLLMLAVAFMPVARGKFLIAWGYFYLAAFGLGGIVLGFIYLWQGNADYYGLVNGIPVAVSNYLWPGIIISLAVTWLAGCFGARVLHRRVTENNVQMGLEIDLFGGKVQASAIVDTGNQLVDPLTGTPVIVVEYRVVQSLLPEDLCRFLEQAGDTGWTGSMVQASDRPWASRIRLIPFHSLGQKNGLLVGIKPDSVEIVLPRGKSRADQVLLGVYQGYLSRENAYQALLHPGLVS